MRLSGRRDVLSGGGLVGAFAVVVACTVWSLKSGAGDSHVAALVVAVLTIVTGAALTRLLWRPLPVGFLLLFPLLLFSAQVALAVSTSGVASSYSGFFGLAIVYVGLTQRPAFVPLAVAVAIPCWLVCQEGIATSTLIHLAGAATTWLLVGLALASRTALDRARNAELIHRANTDALTGLASRS